MNEPRGQDAEWAFRATLAEYFRVKPVRTFCSLSIIYSALPKPVQGFTYLLGRMPSAVRYQPTLATEMGDLQEDYLNKKVPSSVQAIYVPADDRPTGTGRHFCSPGCYHCAVRHIVELGIYPLWILGFHL